MCRESDTGRESVPLLAKHSAMRSVSLMVICSGSRTDLLKARHSVMMTETYSESLTVMPKVTQTARSTVM